MLFECSPQSIFLSTIWALSQARNLESLRAPRAPVMTDSFANHDTSHSNYISIFPLFCLKPVKKWKVKYDWTACFANNESFCTKPNNVGLAESIYSLNFINMPTKTDFSSNRSLRSNCVHQSVCYNDDFFTQSSSCLQAVSSSSSSIQRAFIQMEFKDWLSTQRAFKDFSKNIQRIFKEQQYMSV